ncbi:hypothetical protein GK047_25935 [Paenibacillus sp. SYP-B3998]|uniref:Uncharacterized protein n=1 Tax=Paenibacillus sp. SYP-B3998 TaxID=2678564 RepID=A0A6G4A6F8_9BACL|nr:hypothetical protein [Paenibacillus sp. SYP-B3998]NEW09389.1 hypothetical protein [Paenibacillus sp. SYP-B3998]
MNTTPPQTVEMKETSKPVQGSKDEKLKHYEVTLNREIYETNVVSDASGGQGGFKVSLTNGKRSFELKVEEFGKLPLDIKQLSGAKGEKNIIIAAPSGGSDGNMNVAVIKLNKNKDAIELDRDVFSKLSKTSFYDLDSKVNNKELHDWITDKYMGFHTAHFDNFVLDKDNVGTASFRLGYHPTILQGSAKVHFNFDVLEFQLDEIREVSFEDIKASRWCENVTEEKDYNFRQMLGVKSKEGTRSILESGDVNTLVSCGESLDRPLADGQYYLFEAIARFDVNGKNQLLDRLLTYQIKTDIKDENGNYAYTVALIRGITDQKILDRLRSKLSKSSMIQAQRTVKLLINGNGLSVDQIKDIIQDGENSVPINANISVYTSGQVFNSSANTWPGTVLGNAIVAKDAEKIKWLLEHGADPNLPMGNYEFKSSPLRHAFSLADGDYTIAEELLKHGANGDEVVFTMPGEASLNAYFRDEPAITKLLEKYGFNHWYLQDPEEKLELTSKAEILKLKRY